jgi:hypothetical protein
MTTTELVDTLHSFHFPRCSSLLPAITGLTWRIGFETEYEESDDDPPLEIGDDAETIPIDGYLGFYDPHSRRIVIYTQAITTVARRLNCNPKHLTQIVLLHEYAHAILHLGFDDAGEQCATGVYTSIEEIVHESIAQLLTMRGIEARVAQTTNEHAKAAWLQILSVVFPALEQRQSAVYSQWRQFELMPPERLRRVLRAVRRGASLTAWEAFSLFGRSDA